MGKPRDEEMKKIAEECIEWSGRLLSNGYGNLNLTNTTIGVHRLAWALANGRMPKSGMDICHKCDNRRCINPNHLFEGTRSDNMKDAVSKGRQLSPTKFNTHCIYGHTFNEENTFVYKTGPRKGKRRCKTCQIVAQRKYRAKK